MDTWSIVQGYAREWEVTVRDDADAPVMTYTGSEALRGTVGPGRSYAPAFDLSPTWLVPSAGTILVPVSASQSASVEPGQYQVDVGLADGSADFYEGFLVVEWGAGADALPPTYCSVADLLDYAPWLEKLQTQKTVAGFATERAKARQWLDQVVVDRYVGSAGTGSAAMGTASPSLWLRQQLDANRLVRRGKVIEIAAKRSIFLICGAQLARLEEQEIGLGMKFGREAENLAKSLRAEITEGASYPANAAAWPSLVIDCGYATLRG